MTETRDTEVSVTDRVWRGAFAAPKDALVEQFLELRGVEDGEGFLRPTMNGLMPDPHLIADMAKAADRLATAIEQHQSIGILADFDVDGASAAALMFRYCRYFGVRPIVDVPDRLGEGFGPNGRILDEAVARRCHLLLCLDCGTTAAEILNPYRHRLEIMVIDHHRPDADRPEVLALVNPQCSSEGQAHFGDLAAVGVTFMLLVATNTTLRKRGKDVPDLKTLLDLVALGTVCDMVPLQGLNRAFVHRGLECMAVHPQPGIEALLRSTATRRDRVSAEDLSFRLGPRLNAGSRQGFSTLAWQLLSADDAATAKKFSIRLNNLNNQRKQESAALASDAEASLEQGEGFLMAAGEGWPVGILGILAGRLSRRFQRPCFVISYDQGGTGIGSARSVAGVPLASLLQEAVAAGILERGGGHDRAGGFGLGREQHQLFYDFLARNIAAMPQSQPSLDVDFVADLGGINATMLAQLRRLEPFGVGNPEPLFLLRDVRLRKVGLMGTEHLRAQIIDSRYDSLNAVLFNEAQSALGQFLQQHEGVMDLVVRIKADFRNRHAPCAHIEDARG